MQYIVYEQFRADDPVDPAVTREVVGETSDVNEALALVEIVNLDREGGEVEPRVVVRASRRTGKPKEFTEQQYDGATIARAWSDMYRRKHPKMRKDTRTPPKPDGWHLSAWHGLINFATENAQPGDAAYDTAKVAVYREKIKEREFAA